MIRKFKKAVAFLMTFSMCMSLMVGAAFAGESSSAKTSDIQIVKQGERQYYLSDPQEGEVAGPENFDVWTSKTIAGTENEDEFEVTLQVGSTVKAIPNDVAVVLVMDVSGSMMSDETGNRWNWNNMPEGRKRRIEYTREAAIEFAEAYVKDAGNSQRMLSVVQFGNHAQTVLPWTDVNNGGELKDVAKDALNSVQVNFTVDPARFYWDEEAAMEQWGQVDYWDTTEAAAEMVDHFKDYFESSCQEAVLTNYTDCEVAGCTAEDAHVHCNTAGCALTEAHFHCSKCDSTADHKHCTVEGCTSEDAHTHCGYEGCTAAEEHTHCKRCGLTDADHTHVTGCTLRGCETPYEGPHTHCCMHSCDTVLSFTKHHQSWVEYDYRCKNPDPSHSHEFWDSNRAYLTHTRYFGSVWCIGTNMEAGLLLSRNLVNSGMAEGGAIEDIDNVYVILLSDGNPTWRTNETSSTEVELIGQANNDGTWPALKDIVVDGSEDDIAIAEDIKDVANLYAILYSNDLEGKFSLGADHPLNGVSGADWISKSGDYYVGADYVVNCPNATDIETAFLDINDQIDILAKAWMVNDELSGDLSFMEFTQNGKYCSVDSASDETNASIYWNIGRGEPESGTGGMADPYIYTMKYKVKLNSAEDDVKATSLAYDADNSLDAVWTGKYANLQYFIAEKDEASSMKPEEIQAALRDADFTDVSVKGLYGNLEFVKKNGETGQVMPGAGFTLYDAEGNAWGTEVLSDNEGKVVFTGIPKGSYVLQETTVPEGMQKAIDLGMTESWGEMLQNDGTAVPEVILNYPEGNNNNNNNNNGDTDNDPLPPTGPTDEPVEEPKDESPESVEVPDEAVPGADMPGDIEVEPADDEPLVEVEEENPPLSGVPKTGDDMMLWLTLAVLAGAVLAAMSAYSRRVRG